MKKFLLAFIMCFLCLCPLMPDVSANSAIEIGFEEYKSVSSGVKMGTEFVCIYRGMSASYEVDFTNLPTLVEISVGTDKSCAGIVEIRLGSDKGEIIASMDLKNFLTQDIWGRTVATATIKKELKGKQTIFVCYGGYAFDFYNMTFYGSEDGIQKKMLSQPVEDEFGDISDELHKNEINVLSQLGIIDNSSATFNPKLPMTRIMFASMLGNAINAQSYANGNMPFSDISPDDADAAMISGLYNLGIISPTAEGKFNPRAFIKPYEAAAFCTRALGYTFMKFSDTELMNLAVRLKLFRGIDVGSPALTKSDAAAMIYNMLLSDYITPQGISDGNIRYESEKDAIGKYSNIIYSRGTVTENYYTGLYKSKDSDSIIRIDGVEFLPGDTDAASYLGTMCEYFYTEINGKRTLKAIVPESNVNIAVFETSPAQKIVTLNESAVEFYDGDKLCKFRLNSQTAIIYNGVALDTPLSSLVDTSSFVGKVTLIDNDNNRTQDCVWIDSAENIVVGAINGSIIYDLLGSDPIDTEKVCFELYLDGISQMLKTVKPGTVLTLYRSVNRTGDKLVRATSKLSQISGMISELYDTYAVIGEQEFKISSDYTEILYVGDTGIFYLNDFDHLVRFEKDDSMMMVGFLMGVEEGKSGLTVNPSVKLLTEDNGIIAADMAKRVMADGVIIKSPVDLYNGFGDFAGLGNIRLLTPILYKLDIDGKVCIIDTVEEGSKGPNDGLTRLSVSDSYREYGGVLLTSTGWLMKHPVPSDTKVIQVPADGIEEHYKIVTGLGTGDDVFTATPYATKSDSMIANIVVWENCTTGIGLWESPFVITKKAIVYDETVDAAVPCLYGYSSSSKVTYIVDEQTYHTDDNFRKLVDSVKPGDIILPATTNGRLSVAEVVFLSSGEQSNPEGVNAILNIGGTYSKDGDSKKGRVVCGKVVRVEDGYIRLEYDSPENFEVFKITGALLASVDKEDDGKIDVINKMSNTSIFEGQFIVGHINKVSFQMTSAFVLHDIDVE